MNKYAAIVTIILLIASVFFKISQDSITYANTNDVGEITASSLNVREQPSTNARIIGSLSRGARVELHEKQGSWFRISVNDRWGFIHSDFVRVISIGSSSSTNFQVIASGQVTASSLNIRATASTGGRIIGSLSRGNTVELFEKVGQWYRVRVNNGWGFVHGDFLTVKNVSGGSGGSSSGSNVTVIGQGEVTASRLNVRDQANTSGRIIGSLVNGTKIDLYEKSGQWYRIKVNNSWGFVHSDFVSMLGGGTGGGNTNPGTSVIGNGEITASRLNVRDQASTNGSIIGSLDRGVRVELHEKVGQWYKIRYNNRWGFIHSDFVRMLGGGTGGGNTNPGTSVIGNGEVTASRLNVRDQASTNGRIVGSLDRGVRVELHEKVGQWYKIRISNSWGYVHSDFIQVIGGGGSGGSEGSGGSGSDGTSEIIGTGEVTANRLNVRSQPNTSGSVVGTIERGTSVELHERTGQWYKIRFNNQWAYVHGDFIRVNSGSGGTTSPRDLSGRVIFIDPGHGGRDPGAVVNGVFESHLVMQIANKLKGELERAGATVIMSRSNDTFVALGDRVKMANGSNAQIFVSLHMNSFMLPSASGVEMFYDRTNSGAGSKKLAESLQREMVDRVGLRNRGVIERNLEVIRFTKVPAVLAELGFMTNPNDLDKLMNGQDQIVDALVEGIYQYFK